MTAEERELQSRSLRREVNERVAELIEALGDSLENVVAAATTIGSAVIAAHAAPADPRKRAAG